MMISDCTIIPKATAAAFLPLIQTSPCPDSLYRIWAKVPIASVWCLAARTVAGVAISTVGLLLLLFAGVDFNNLFFVQKLLTKTAIPAYNQTVVLPAMLGVLVLLDGAFVLGLKRAFSFSAHLLGNLVWLYALYLLNANLAVPVAEIGAYQQIYYLLFFGILLFAIGSVINDIPKKQK